MQRQATGAPGREKERMQRPKGKGSYDKGTSAFTKWRRTIHVFNTFNESSMKVLTTFILYWGGHDEALSLSEHPEKKHNEETSTNLARAEPGKYSGEAGMSKDTSGSESPGELWRSWYVEGHLGYEGVSSGEAKLTHIFTKIE
ncbi:hypothetical protein Tco_1413934, partial [Tanacetum coccineum]